MLSIREVRLDYEESESVRIYRDSLLRMKEVCLGQNVQAIYVSRHDNLVPMQLLDRYLELCDAIIAGKITGTSVDESSDTILTVIDDIVSLLYGKADLKL